MKNRKIIPFISKTLFFLVFIFSTTNSWSARPDSFSVNLPGHIVGKQEITARINILDPGGELDSSVNRSIDFMVNEKVRPLKFKNGKATVAFSMEKSGKVMMGPKESNKRIEKYVRVWPGWLSVLPPVLAIVLAFVFKEVVISLVIGIFSGLLLIYGVGFHGLVISVFRFADTYLMDVLSDRDHLAIIVFSMMIGGMVALISRNGGMEGLVEKLKLAARTRRRSMFVTWLLGVIIFFDDYANTLIVGKTMRPLTDKFRISKEKLAYIVDSTAAPVVSVAFITTWIGAQLDYINGALETLPVTANAYAIFLQSLPYAFYPVLTLIFMLFLIFQRKDFGPMLVAERKSLSNTVTTTPEYRYESKSKAGKKSFWDAVIPVLLLIIVAFGALVKTGFEPALWEKDRNFFLSLARVIGNSDPYAALLWASLISLSVAFLITLIRRTFGVKDTIEIVLDGFKSLFGALLILVLAWTLAAVSQKLNTTGFLSGLITGNVYPGLFPVMIFVLSAVVSFSTGSSWGTMAILYPLALPVTYNAGMAGGFEVHETMAIFHHVVAAVLAGSVFGDHCSPISDTTILSSLASDCDHIQHVRTQLPYALTTGLVSMMFGYFLTGFTAFPPWVAFIAGIIVLWVVVRIGGKKV